MWAVGITRPYYPSVEFIENEIEAYKEYMRLLKEEATDDGTFDCKAFMAKVEQISDIKTDY